jgi:DNA-binding transcriptional LysR family regulator
MDRYRRMAILAKVVESGSLRAAAHALAITPSAVSQQIRRLEQEAGVTLLRRSTRRMTLTEAGAAFYEGCAAMVAAAEGAHARLADLQNAPVGELSVSAPPGFAATHLAPAMASLLRAHPALRMRVVVTDDKPDLIRDRIDIAITIGRPLPSSSLVRHHLADWELGLCASPAYLARRGMPADPAALARHDFIALPHWHHGTDVLIGPGGRRHRLAGIPRVSADNQHLVRQFTLAGAGLSFQALPEVGPEVASGRLVRVLALWRSPPLGVAALLLERAQQPVKVRLALAALKEHLPPLEAKPRKGRVGGSRG